MSRIAVSYIYWFTHLYNLLSSLCVNVWSIRKGEFIVMKLTVYEKWIWVVLEQNELSRTGVVYRECIGCFTCCLKQMKNHSPEPQSHRYNYAVRLFTAITTKACTFSVVVASILILLTRSFRSESWLRGRTLLGLSLVLLRYCRQIPVQYRNTVCRSLPSKFLL
jgi:hypothetical protein